MGEKVIAFTTCETYPSDLSMRLFEWRSPQGQQLIEKAEFISIF